MKKKEERLKICDYVKKGTSYSFQTFTFGSGVFTLSTMVPKLSFLCFGS